MIDILLVKGERIHLVITSKIELSWVLDFLCLSSL